MNALADTHRRLAALTEIASGGKVTQRSLATRLGVSLGLANGLLRELERGGLVTVNRAAASQRPRYRLTNAGRSALVRLGAEYATGSTAPLARLRDEMQRRAARAADKGARKALLCGSGWLADMAASAVLNAGMKLAGVVSPDADAGPVAGLKVRPMADAGRIRCDVAVALNPRDANALRAHLGRRIPVTLLLTGACSAVGRVSDPAQKDKKRRPRPVGLQAGRRARSGS